MYVAVMLAVCERLTVPAAAMNVALDCPGETVTVVGTVTTALELLSEIVAELLVVFVNDTVH